MDHTDSEFCGMQRAHLLSGLKSDEFCFHKYETMNPAMTRATTSTAIASGPSLEFFCRPGMALNVPLPVLLKQVPFVSLPVQFIARKKLLQMRQLDALSRKTTLQASLC